MKEIPIDGANIVVLKLRGTGTASHAIDGSVHVVKSNTYVFQLICFAYTESESQGELTVTMPDK